MGINGWESIGITNYREAQFLLNELRGFGLDISEFEPKELIEKDLNAVSSFINNAFISLVPQRKGLTSNIIKFKMNSALLSDGNFSWLKDNKRATFWVWGQIYLFHSFGLTGFESNDIFIKEGLDIQASLRRNPVFSHGSRFDDIVYAFDLRMKISYSEKQSIISFCHRYWANIFSDDKALKWISKRDIGLCQWAFNYIREHQSRIALPVIDSIGHYFGNKQLPDLNDTPANLLPEPVDNEELFNSILAMYDLWRVTPEKKELFLIHINKAWNQKKVRDNRKGKKALNTHISEGAKDRLMLLAYRHNMNIGPLLEMLIEKEFSSSGGKL
ncbi:TPA: hypothetical protein RY435_004022 [Escherichia albertii]|uniref:hypothetical protein n=1 Tax=Escherichia albertii TaxID=208962 RepID=UPI0007443749|nr:hypothetical protein [Escherichia albertii]HEB1530387.1 hypothetical protein [Escherichia albertii]HEB1544470.1 hypothetical protein [Escherichia albertii]